MKAPENTTVKTTKKAAKKKLTKLTAEQWKEIAWKLAYKVNFAINHLKADGAGVTFHFDKDGNYVEGKHWKDEFADAIELIPSVAKIDRELMHIRSLPRKQRDKAIKELEARRAAEETAREKGAADER